MEQASTAGRRSETWVGTMRDWIMVKEAWLMAIAADQALPPYASAVGIVLASHFNRRDGKAFLGFERLVGLVGGAKERTIQRSLAAMQKANLLERELGFPGRNTRYKISDAFVLGWRERVSPETERVSSQSQRMSPATPITSDTTSDQTSDATAYDTPCGVPSETALLVEAVRQAAAIQAPFSIHWTDEHVVDALTYWTEELRLGADAILGCITELRRIRPEVSFNAPTYFHGRMRDIAARRDPEYAPPITPEDHLAAVVGRETAAEAVEWREELGEPLDPSEAMLIADKLRTYKDPQRAVWAMLSNGSRVPIEDGQFGVR